MDLYFQTLLVQDPETWGGLKGGQPQRSDERLFMRLLAFGGCTDPKGLGGHLVNAGVTGVVYED